MPCGNLKTLLAWPTIASKNWVYRQYDHMVRDGTVVCPARTPPSSASRAIPCTRDASGDGTDAPSTVAKYIAMTVDCNAAYVYLDPYEGGKTAVAEAARNLACSGAVPLRCTDNLNFGNPHNPENFLAAARNPSAAWPEACRAFNAPVTGGNVSLYNQSPAGRSIRPRPSAWSV